MTVLMAWNSCESRSFTPKTRLILVINQLNAQIRVL